MRWDVVLEILIAVVPALVAGAAFTSWYLKISFKAFSSDLIDRLDDRYVRRNGGSMTGGELERRIDFLEGRKFPHAPTR